jgi:hypothetical protein
MIRLSLFSKQIFSHCALYFPFKKERQILGFYDTSCVIVSDAPTFLLTVLSNPAKRQQYDKKGILYVQDQNVAVSNYFFSVVILFPGCSHTLCCLPTISGLPEPAQGFNTHLQWPWHKVLGMVSMFRDATVCIHLQSWLVSNCKIPSSKKGYGMAVPFLGS